MAHHRTKCKGVRDLFMKRLNWNDTNSTKLRMITAINRQRGKGHKLPRACRGVKRSITRGETPGRETHNHPNPDLLEGLTFLTPPGVQYRRNTSSTKKIYCLPIIVLFYTTPPELYFVDDLYSHDFIVSYRHLTAMRSLNWSSPPTFVASWRIRKGGLDLHDGLDFVVKLKFCALKLTPYSLLLLDLTRRNFTCD